MDTTVMGQEREQHVEQVLGSLLVVGRLQGLVHQRTVEQDTTVTELVPEEHAVRAGGQIQPVLRQMQLALFVQ